MKASLSFITPFSASNKTGTSRTEKKAWSLIDYFILNPTVAEVYLTDPG